jgi:secondary thiamine-phosphate synthase enzyme
MVFGKEISFRTEGFSDLHNVTDETAGAVADSGIRNGMVLVSVIGSTGSVSTIEYEPALEADFRETIDGLIPQDRPSRHSRTWGDDNGFSHLRATLMGPGIVVPVSEGKLVLGTWQQIVVIDHDNRPRTRRVFLQVVGE